MTNVTIGVEMTPELKDLMERAESITAEFRSAATHTICSVVRNALADDDEMTAEALEALAIKAAKAMLAGVNALTQATDATAA